VESVNLVSNEALQGIVALSIINRLLCNPTVGMYVLYTPEFCRCVSLDSHQMEHISSVVAYTVVVDGVDSASAIVCRSARGFAMLQGIIILVL